VDWVYKGSRRISDTCPSGGSDSDASDKAKNVRFQELMNVTLGLVITLRFLAANADMHFGRLDPTAMSQIQPFGEAEEMSPSKCESTLTKDILGVRLATFAPAHAQKIGLLYYFDLRFVNFGLREGRNFLF
jgi:hypothetical protein